MARSVINEKIFKMEAQINTFSVNGDVVMPSGEEQPFGKFQSKTVVQRIRHIPGGLNRFRHAVYKDGKLIAITPQRKDANLIAGLLNSTT